MTIIKLTIALLAVSATSYAQHYQNSLTPNNPSRSGSNCRGACPCPQQYLPFCGTDGQQETTFSNKCQLECARKCNPNLRVKFEGVCARRYEHNGGAGNGKGNGNGGSPSRTQQQQQQPIRGGYDSRPSGSRPQSSISFPPSQYFPGSSGSVEYRPNSVNPTGRPRPSFPYQTTTTTVRPRYSSTRSYSRYDPTTTTQSPWWNSAQSRYPIAPESNRPVAGYGTNANGWRQNRNADGYDNYNDEEEDDESGADI